MSGPMMFGPGGKVAAAPTTVGPGGQPAAAGANATAPSALVATAAATANSCFVADIVFLLCSRRTTGIGVDLTQPARRAGGRGGAQPPGLRRSSASLLWGRPRR